MDSMRRWILPILLIATIAYASGRGNPQVPGGGFPGLDKIAHILVFGLIATSICRLHPQWALSRTMAVIAILLTAFFGLVDEWLQSMNPNRFFEWADFLADVTGAVVAVFVYQKWNWYRNVLESQPFLIAKNLFTRS